MTFAEQTGFTHLGFTSLLSPSVSGSALVEAPMKIGLQQVVVLLLEEVAQLHLAMAAAESSPKW